MRRWKRPWAISAVSHTVEVTAESLYEAVALGLKAIRGRDWVEGLRDQFRVDVSVSEFPVRHSVEMKEFNSWLQRDGGTTRDLVQRNDSYYLSLYKKKKALKSFLALCFT